MEEEEEEGGGGGGWIVSFADLMTLLFAAFVVLYGITPKGKSDTITGVVSSIRESFIEVPDDIPTVEKKGPIHKGKFIYKAFKGDALRMPAIKKYPKHHTAIKTKKKDMAEMVALVEEILKNKSNTLDTKGVEDPIQVVNDVDGFKIRLLASAFYDPGKYKIKKKFQGELEKIGKQLKALGREIVVEGHTDAVPPKKGMTNWELSALRASYVARFFINQIEFPDQLISVAAYADRRPIGDNTNPKGRLLNRRVEIKVRYSEQ